MIKVKLTCWELDLAEYWGEKTFRISKELKFKRGYGLSEKEDTVEKSIEGVLGELAVAKGLNMYWQPQQYAFKKPDVGPFHVRSSPIPKDLVIRPSDSNGVYIKVIGRYPYYEIVGWYEKSKVKKEWLEDRGNRGYPAYFVPLEELRLIEDLL